MKLLAAAVCLLLDAAELAGEAFDASRLVYRLLRDARRAARSQRERYSKGNLRSRRNSPMPRG